MTVVPSSRVGVAPGTNDARSDGRRVRLDDAHPAPVHSSGDAVGRLVADHSVLFDEVERHCQQALTAIADHRWPTRELEALTGYLRSQLVRQIQVEETLMSAGADAGSGEDVRRLARDHVRLRSLLGALTHATGAEGRLDPQALAATLRDLMTQLRRHLVAERRVLVEHAARRRLTPSGGSDAAERA
jgi:hypothetical protein